MQAEQVRRGETFCLNLRFMLIVCVFVGNAIEPLIAQNPAVKTLFLWIFTFHMPLFVFVTGYFAKTNLFGQQGSKTLKQIAIQYVIFQTIYSMLDAFVFQIPGTHHSFFAPYWLLWFLVSHLCWRLILMAVLKFNVKYAVIISIILGVCIGYLQVEGTWLSISRTFVYLPFFMIGYFIRIERIVNFFSPVRRIFGILFSLTLFVILLQYTEFLNPRWFYGSFTFGQIGEADWSAGFTRLLLYGLQFIASLAFLAWIPQRESRLTDWGRRTLYVFLLHGLIVRFAVYFGVYSYILNPLSIVLLISAAILFTILLAQPWVKQIAHPLIEPQTQWIVRLQRRPTHER